MLNVNAVKLCELVWQCHDKSWNVTKSHNVFQMIKLCDIWWHQDDNIQSLVSPKKRPSEMLKKTKKKTKKKHGDILWHMKIFGDMTNLLLNHVFYHNMSWHIVNFHDMSPIISERKLDASKKNHDHKNMKFLWIMVKGPTKNISTNFWSSSLVPFIEWIMQKPQKIGRVFGLCWTITPLIPPSARRANFFARWAKLS